MQREEIMEGNGEFIDEEIMVQIGGGDQCEGSQYDDIELNTTNLQIFWTAF